MGKFIFGVIIALVVLCSCCVACFACIIATGALTNNQPSGTLNDATQEESGGDFEISLERTPCFGFCPAYKVTIKNNGDVEFEGYSSVDSMGGHDYKISKDDVKKLKSTVESSKFFQLKNSYENFNVTDLPGSSISVTLGGRTKSIKMYGIEGTDIPMSLVKLAEQIDSVGNTNLYINNF
jgi:hypothetical protein